MNDMERKLIKLLAVGLILSWLTMGYGANVTYKMGKEMRRMEKMIHEFTFAEEKLKGYTTEEITDVVFLIELMNLPPGRVDSIIRNSCD